MRIETLQDVHDAIEHVSNRDRRELAAFIVSLAQDPGPVGDQVRTFIVGDDVAETVASVQARLAALSVPEEYAYRHARGQEIGKQLGYIVNSIGSLVLPMDPAAAFELLVGVFERDGQAMEQCGDHHWEVEVALQRAAELMAAAAKSLPAPEVAERIRALMAKDGYGVRAELKTLIPLAAKSP